MTAALIRVAALNRSFTVWLRDNGYTESEHFVTQNAYLCVEINVHMMTNTVVNVIKGRFPKDTLRFWLSDSQACEQTFRLLRSKITTFSTSVNFSIKGILQRLHKLSYIPAAESADDLIFPRVQRKILQLSPETTDTFTVPTLQEIFDCIEVAKRDAISSCNKCGIRLKNYGDEYLVANTENTIGVAENENEAQDATESDDIETTNRLTQRDAILINEDFAQIRLRKVSTNGPPAYEEYLDEGQSSKSKTYQFSKHGFSSFVRYENAYIRKTTALYLIPGKLSGI